MFKETIGSAGGRRWRGRLVVVVVVVGSEVAGCAGEEEQPQETAEALLAHDLFKRDGT